MVAWCAFTCRTRWQWCRRPWIHVGLLFVCLYSPPNTFKVMYLYKCILQNRVAQWRSFSFEQSQPSINPQFRYSLATETQPQSFLEQQVLLAPTAHVCRAVMCTWVFFWSTDQHDYENVPEQKVLICADAEEDRDYLNVEPLHFQSKSPHLQRIRLTLCLASSPHWSTSPLVFGTCEKT